eukprot:1184774-Prorocentrum_minimum.AAC.2
MCMFFLNPESGSLVTNPQKKTQQTEARPPPRQTRPPPRQICPPQQQIPLPPQQTRPPPSRFAPLDASRRPFAVHCGRYR